MKHYPHGQNKHLSEEVKEHVRKMQKEARNKSSASADKVGYPDKDSRWVEAIEISFLRSRPLPQADLKS
jgi:cell division control protein 7